MGEGESPPLMSKPPTNSYPIFPQEGQPCGQPVYRRSHFLFFIFSPSILLELLLIKRGNHHQLPHLLSEDDTELDVTGIDSPFTTMLFSSSVFV